jgi:CxxC motif-containing protein (DUF1111 family)
MNKVHAGKSRVLSLFRLLAATSAIVCLAPLLMVVVVRAQSQAQDPGVRPGPPGAGKFFSTLSQNQKSLGPLFTQDFNNVFGVTTAETGLAGLGPRFNSNECELCHSQPAAGGASTFVNQAFLVYNDDGATNTIPYFESSSGAMQNARFPQQLGNLGVPDGLVHAVFTITGRADAGSCDIAQPDFSEAQSENDIEFRVPPPMFGDGLMEIIREKDILSNQSAQCAQEASTGICGTPNYASDGSIGRFGWKAQNRSALIFISEALTGEMGVTDEAFPNENDETTGCVINGVPEDHSNFATKVAPSSFPGTPERLALFVRFLAPPTPAPPNSTTINGQNQFNFVGCNICHSSPSPTQFVTPTSAISALSNQNVNLFSDLLVHHMGNCLADGVTQGAAAGDMFRTAPLWGVGQRIFFMHDGRTSDIVQAVEDHSDSFCTGSTGKTGYQSSEADAVVSAFNALTVQNQQDLIDFIRSL